MRFFLTVTFFLLMVIFSQAQHSHFVYLQTDNKQPFYIKVKEKLLSSSASGYVVIPKLEAGKHTLIVGFPKEEWPIQNFTINIADKDLGFSLKNFETKGWGLFNLQTMEVLTANTESSKQTSITTEVKTDQFSNVLADVVNTPSIKEEKKEIIIIPATIPIKKEVNEEKPALVIEKKEDTGWIQKLSTTSNSDEMLIVYLDKQLSGSDTIDVVILKDSIKTEDTLKPIINIETEKIPETKEKSQEVPIKSDESKNNPKFIEIELPNPNTKVEPTKTVNQPNSELTSSSGNELSASQSNTPAKPVMINSDCKQNATDDDFLKIRKKMTSENTDDEMVSVAKKMFKQKCYSTEQIKNLSVLFLKEEGKYKLFDAAYPFVYDTQNFKLLESQLSDPYYISRFKAMIRN